MEIHDDVEAVKLSEEFRDAFIQGLALSVPITIGILVFCWVMSFTYRTTGDNVMESVEIMNQAIKSLTPKLEGIENRLDSGRYASSRELEEFSSLVNGQTKKARNLMEELITETQLQIFILRKAVKDFADEFNK